MYTAAPANAEQLFAVSTSDSVIASGTPSATPDALPMLDVMSLRTTPLSLSTSGPLEPSPGNGPPVSLGMVSQATDSTLSVVTAASVVAAAAVVVAAFVVAAASAALVDVVPSVVARRCRRRLGGRGGVVVGSTGRERREAATGEERQRAPPGEQPWEIARQSAKVVVVVIVVATWSTVMGRAPGDGRMSLHVLGRR